MNLLYHYCSVATLMKIIESASIHCSNISLANDPDEITLATREIFPSFWQGLSDSAFYGVDNTDEFFVLSLSKKPDLLSQWRGYADMGRGVMLALDLDALKACNYSFDMIPNHIHPYDASLFGTPVFKALEVCYDKQRFYAQLQDTFVEFDDGKLERSARSFDITDTNLIAFMNRLNDLKAAYKSKFYQEEEEVRCVIHASKNDAGYPAQLLRAETRGESSKLDVKYVDVRGQVSPRYPLRLKFKHVNALYGVMLGPANLNTPAMLRVLLQQHGFADTTITTSAGNFRFGG